MIEHVLKLRVGDLVEVRDYSEILSTLDERGRIEGLPFMPEMIRFCGKRFTVHGRADRTCVETHRARGMNNTVWLEGVRCDGTSHDGCTIECNVFWKEAWLKRVSSTEPNHPGSQGTMVPYAFKVKEENTNRYICQSSELANATFPLDFFGNVKTYWNDLRYGNLPFFRLTKVLFIYVVFKVFGRYGIVQHLSTDQTKTPTESLNLQAGEWVEVKSPEEIRATLDASGKNRGVSFGYDSLEYSGKRLRVMKRVEKVIDENTGQMRAPKNSVILEGAPCTGTYRRGCARCTYLMWREIWLKRVDVGANAEGPKHTPGERPGTSEQAAG